jgi:hypothetical protein
MTARISAAAGGALLVAALLPAAAQAAAFTVPLKPCYVTAGTAAAPQSEGFTVTAAGFGVNSKVQLAIDGQPVPGGEELQADAAGNLTVPAPVPAPFIAKGARDFSVTLTDLANPANVATATAKTTALRVGVKPRKARPSRRVRFSGDGFTQAKPVFAHYLYGGKIRRTVRMVKRTGVCGTWTARKPQIPVDNPASGAWKVQFDQSRKYVKPAELTSGVYVRLSINVSRVFTRG